jgi:hypothetical protein
MNFEKIYNKSKLHENRDEATHYGYETENSTGNYIIYEIGNNPGSKYYDESQTVYIQSADDISILEQEIADAGDDKEVLNRVLSNYWY